MTPQEKAKELIESFIPLVANEHYNEKALECALITVGEILNMHLEDPSALDKEYWYEVKKEICDL